MRSEQRPTPQQAELDEIERRFAASADGSRERRTRPPERPRRRTFHALLCLAGLLLAGAGISGGGVQLRSAVAITSAVEIPPQLLSAAPRAAQGRRPWPARGAVAAAERIAKDRGGLVSFAAIGPGGRAVGLAENRPYYSASASKSLLLVAELRRLRREGLPLDPATHDLLDAMITLSDNDAAEVIYGRVGDAGLNEVATLAGMRDFSADVGHWSNARITAADMARFMARLEGLLELPGGGIGGEMLASVDPSQSWGVPAAAPKGSLVQIKGGWRPTETGELVHQAARVETGGRRYALAILTDGQPTMAHGTETIRLIARELLRTRPAGSASAAERESGPARSPPPRTRRRARSRT